MLYCQTRAGFARRDLFATNFMLTATPHGVTKPPTPSDMPTQITRFSPHQTAKLFAVIYGVLGLIFVPFILVISSFGPAGSRISPAFAIMFPIIYLVFGYIFVTIGCHLYNFVAKHLGGIEVETRSVGGDQVQ